MNASARKARLLFWSFCGVAALALPLLVTPTALVIYNPSDSVPRGWYRVTQAASLHVGDYAVAALPPDAAALAAQRGYLPAHIPVIKRIGAMPPQWVCVSDGVVSIDGAAVAATLAADPRGRTLLAWRQCRRLIDDELFLLSATNPDSFDSRYFGPIKASSVFGQALPLWTSDAP
ncbi:MAG: peptidase [Hydrocarboniphaga sp.]|uniref:S26 family signal peptidase n=1 Tax=Hydrocarboniphaga sp. TaxID=2033016 RepID=UPI002625AF4B|nr:S26 family signal peptidase [Hydrocarboniphaga sp.]MDB5971132.1 peptidase [Hydrocarboniphaga sp.]